MMNKLALYVFPLGVVVGGPFLPLAIILYWFSNNIWTFGQQHYVFSMIEKEEEAKKQEALERRAANAPAPGPKPKRTPKAVAGSNGSPAESEDVSDTDATETSGEEAPSGDTKRDKPNSTARNSSPTNRTPRPGVRPKKRKR